jgi:hypothetical protein
MREKPNPSTAIRQERSARPLDDQMTETTKVTRQGRTGFEFLLETFRVGQGSQGAVSVSGSRDCCFELSPLVTLTKRATDVDSLLRNQLVWATWGLKWDNLCREHLSLQQAPSGQEQFLSS